MSAPSSPPWTELWLVPAQLGGSPPLGRLLAALPLEEQAESRALRDPLRRREFIVSRALVRLILGARLGVSADSVPLARSNLGKPHLAGFKQPRDPPFHFSYSHSAGCVLLSIDIDAPVGVDIEVIGPTQDRIARRFFSSCENDVLTRLPRDLQAAEFCRVWTVKEAVSKALGRGLSMPLREVPVANAPEGECGGCRWWSLPVGETHRAAVAIELAPGASRPEPSPPHILTSADLLGAAGLRGFGATPRGSA